MPPLRQKVAALTEVWRSKKSDEKQNNSASHTAPDVDGNHDRAGNLGPIPQSSPANSTFLKSQDLQSFDMYSQSYPANQTFLGRQDPQAQLPSANTFLRSQHIPGYHPVPPQQLPSANATFLGSQNFQYSPPHLQPYTANTASLGSEDFQSLPSSFEIFVEPRDHGPTAQSERQIESSADLLQGNRAPHASYSNECTTDATLRRVRDGTSDMESSWSHEDAPVTNADVSEAQRNATIASVSSTNIDTDARAAEMSVSSLSLPSASPRLRTLFSPGETPSVTSNMTTPVGRTNGRLTQLQRANVDFLMGIASSRSPIITASKDCDQEAVPPVNSESADAYSLPESPSTVYERGFTQVTAANTSFFNVSWVPQFEFNHAGLEQQRPSGTESGNIPSSTSLYTSLEHLPRAIRLLRFDVGPGDTLSDGIRCCLSTVQPWHHTVSYNCLSYCWGSTEGKQRLMIRTPESDYHTVAVTANLHDALRRLRSAHRSSSFWIDAISINQDDMRERSAQVSMMKDIYNMASSIIVWLGESTPSLDASVSSISAISKTFEADIRNVGEVIGFSGLNMTAGELERLGSYCGRMVNEAYESLGNLFSLPYFRRVWVLQEVFAHTSVIVRLGERIFSWSSIILAALWQSFYTRSHTIKASDSPGSRGYLPELWLGLLHTRPERGLSMMELVSRARDFVATDPRDKVFALLGLANDLGDSSGRLHGLVPDYSLPKELVYCAFAKDYIATTKNLDILSAVNPFAIHLRTAKRSTWMPDLDHPIATIRGFGFPKKYDASLSSAVDPNQLGSGLGTPPVLSLFGFAVDTVHNVSEAPLIFASNLKVYTSNGDDAVTKLWLDHVQPAQRHHSDKERLRRYIKLLTAAGFALPTEFPTYPLGRIVPSREVPSLIADFAAYWSRLDPDFELMQSDFRTELKVQARKGDADQFGVLVGKACHERTFFATAQGRMGLCPRDTRAGDLMVILYGGSVPYVLRKVGERVWKFVGECYVDGIMFGEAMGTQAVDQLYNII